MTQKTLLRLIEDHLESIATRTIQAIRLDEDLLQVRRLSEWELRDWAKLILRSLADWPVEADDRTLNVRYESLGRQRFQDAIPLHQGIRRIQHLKWAVVSWVRDQSFPQSSSDLYALEEFEHHVNLCFDQLVFLVARGYEAARREKLLSA